MIVRLRRARGLLAICAVPSGLVWAGLVAVSVLLHSPSDVLAGPSGSITGPHLHRLSLSSFQGSVRPEGACAACAFQGNPAAGAGLAPSGPGPQPVAPGAIALREELRPRPPATSVLGRAPPRS